MLTFITLDSRDAERFWGHVEKSGECWLWTGPLTSSGYGLFTRRRRWMVAHQLVWDLINGKRPNGVFVGQKCGNKVCVRPDHLYLRVATDPYFHSLTVDRHFWAHVRKSDGCWEWTGLKVYGYGKALLFGKTLRAHRVAWELANGPIPNGLFVCHHCDNPSCVRVDHLFLGTPRDNVVDMERKGRHPHTVPPEKRPRGDHHYSRTEPWRLARGEGHGNAVITSEIAREVKQALASGEKPTRIMRRLNLARHIVYSIKYGYTWKDA